MSDFEDWTDCERHMMSYRGRWCPRCQQDNQEGTKGQRYSGEERNEFESDDPFHSCLGGVLAALLAVVIVIIVLFTLFGCTMARAAEDSTLQRYLKQYNCAWVNQQLKTMTPEQLEAKARKWHVPEELIQLGKQCPR